MKKDFLMDNNKVRNCYSNVAKMNAFEYIYYDFKDWGAMKNFPREFMDTMKTFFEVFFCFLANIFSLVFFPVVLLFNAQHEINRAKKFCKKWEKGE